MKREQQEPGRWHRHALRVRYQETDRMGVVYHANYINWFEIGRTELIRERGMPYSRIEESGLYLPVVELASKFVLPARYDDELVIYTRIASYTPMTIAFQSEVRRMQRSGEGGGGSGMQARPAAVAAGEMEEGNGGNEPQGELLVSGGTRHVWLNRDWKPVRLDRIAPQLLELLGREG